MLCTTRIVDNHKKNPAVFHCSERCRYQHEEPRADRRKHQLATNKRARVRQNTTSYWVDWSWIVYRQPVNMKQLSWCLFRRQNIRLLYRRQVAQVL